MLKKILILCLMVCLVLTVAAGCGSTPPSVDPEKSVAPDAVKVGIAAPDVTHGWIAGVTYAAEKCCREQGLDYKITTSADAAEMTAAFGDLEQWGADVIIIYPQWTGMETAVSELIERGIKVIGFDIKINADGICQVTGDNYGMGRECAKYIVEKAGEAANIAVLDNPSVGSVSQLRKQGFYDYLKEINYDTGGIFEISSAAFTRDNGLKDMADVLQSHDRVDAVFSMDDETSIGVVQAITEAGRTDIKAITGGGGMQEYFKMIADEKYRDLGLASALYSPTMVEDAIRAGISLVKGEECEQMLVIPTRIVTAENVAELIDPDNTIY